MKTAPSSLVRTSIAAALLALVATVACAQTVYVQNGNSISKIVSGSPAAFTTSAISDPIGMTFGPGGYLYVSANGSDSLATVAPDGTVAAFGTTIHQPIGLAFGAGGNLYVATNNTPAGVEQVTVPGGSVTAFPTTSPFHNATAVAYNPGTSTLYVADYYDGTISKVAANGTVSSFASGLTHPYGLAFGPGGILYVANYGAGDASGQGFISKVDASGTVSSWAVTGVTFFQPTGLAFDQYGNLFVANHGSGDVFEITPAGSGSIFATGLTAPGGIAVSAIPEPSICTALFGLAALGFAAYRRRHR